MDQAGMVICATVLDGNDQVRLIVGDKELAFPAEHVPLVVYALELALQERGSPRSSEIISLKPN
jgi:hypothetical protein